MKKKVIFIINTILSLFNSIIFTIVFIKIIGTHFILGVILFIAAIFFLYQFIRNIIRHVKLEVDVNYD